MEIKLTNASFRSRKWLLKIIMRTFIFLCCITSFGLSPSNIVSQSSKVNIEESQLLTVDEVFDLVMEQTNYKFFYEEGLFKDFAKVRLKKGKINTNKLLEKSLSQGNLDVKMTDNNAILISIKSIEEKEVIVEEPQTHLVSGIVTDSDGNPLPGASILEKGTTNGTESDFDGNFSLNVTNTNAILTVSFIGYLSQEISVSGQEKITIELLEDAANLEEVVIIGYGTQKEALLTGSVGIVDSEEIKKVSYANSASALQGRVPGVKVEANGGAPGAGVNVVIRGTGSFGNDQPLYVIDGNIVGSMSFLNPNDIQSISVLKDASSAAIYGSRASNGVVLITTKKGKAGDVQINLETKLGFQKPTNTLDFLNARQYADWHNMARDNDGDARAVPNDTGFDSSIDTDWQDLSLNTAMYQEYNLNISGGSENAQFYVSGQILDQEGIVVDSGFKKYNLAANTSFKKGIFSMTQSLLLSRSENNPNNFFIREGAVPPTIPVYDENNEGGFAGLDPNLHGLARGINWYGRAIIHENLYTTDRLVGSIQPQFKLSENLTYKLNLGIDYSVLHNYAFQPTFFQSTSQEASESIARLTENYVRSLSTLIENTVEYSNVFGKHGVTVLAGYTTQSITARSAGGVGTNFPFNDYRVLDAADGNTDNATGDLQENSLTSYLGRVDYDYDGKYIISATVRRDGSSRFKEDNRWAVFPSGSLGWRISEEDFFPQDGIVNSLKFRGSYGLLGSQNIGNYLTSSTLNTNNFYNLGGTVYSGSIVTNLANPNLKWETTTIQNYGFDAELLSGKISFSAEYFKKRSEDILVNVPIPLSGGLGGSLVNNAATIDNRGFEFGGTYRHISINDGVNFDVNLNFNTIKNEVIALGDGVNPITGGGFTQGGWNATRTDVGQPVGSFFGYVVEGVYQTQAEIDADGRTGIAELGDLNFLDLDNSGDIGDEDQKYLGSPIPDFEYSLAFNMDYKNLDFSLFVQGVEGNELWNAKRYHYILDATRGIKTTDVIQSWTPQNTNTSIPRATIRDVAVNKRSSDFLVEDGSYLRLKMIQMGYTLPSHLAEKIYLSNVRFFVSGQNLLTITDYTSYDPELGRPLNGSGSLFDGGVDRRAYPNNKSFIFGIQIGF